MSSATCKLFWESRSLNDSWRFILRSHTDADRNTRHYHTQNLPNFECFLDDESHNGIYLFYKTQSSLTAVRRYLISAKNLSRRNTAQLHRRWHRRSVKRTEYKQVLRKGSLPQDLFNLDWLHKNVRTHRANYFFDNPSRRHVTRDSWIPARLRSFAVASPRWSSITEHKVHRRR